MSNLLFGMGGAASVKHLVVSSWPFVGDPLVSNENWAPSVGHPDVVTSTLVHVPPNNNRPLARFDVSSN